MNYLKYLICFLFIVQILSNQNLTINSTLQILGNNITRPILSSSATRAKYFLTNLY